MNVNQGSTKNPTTESTGTETVKTNPYEEDLTKPYVDKRSITISPIHNYSFYRKANIKVFGNKKEIIGSSVTSCQILSSGEEVNYYFPNIVGLSYKHPDFTTRVKMWLSNIRLIISDTDTKLDTSFVYNTKKDYLDIKKKEDDIIAAYDAVPRNDMNAIKEGIARYIDDLNTLESTKYAYGKPVNILEYLMYRHCLLYKDVAKDLSLVNSDPNVRFFIKDENKELEKEKKVIQEKKTAMKNFVTLCGSENKFNSFFAIMTVSNNGNLLEELLKTNEQKEAIVMTFLNDNPFKFNKLYNDSHLEIKAFIEKLIVRGELIRSDFNQQISTSDGTFIASNMKEAVAYFINPDNEAVKTAYEKKLKAI